MRALHGQVPRRRGISTIGNSDQGRAKGTLPNVSFGRAHCADPDGRQQNPGRDLRGARGQGPVAAGPAISAMPIGDGRLEKGGLSCAPESGELIASSTAGSPDG
jgi:hypothetical protein